MAETKNLCAQIPIALHERVSEERERLGQNQRVHHKTHSGILQ